MQSLRYQLQYILRALSHIPIILCYRLPRWPMMRFGSNTLFDNLRNVLLKEELTRHEPSYHEGRKSTHCRAMLSLEFDPPSPMITLIFVLLRRHRSREPLPCFLYLALSPK